jgi:hypothetical protein
MPALKMLPAVLALSLLAAPAFARPGAPPDAKAPAAASGKSRQKNAKQREARRLAAMKKAGVDQARAKQVIAVHERYQRERQPVARDAKQHRTAMRQLEKGQRRNDPAYAREKEAFEAARTKVRAINARQKQEVSKILTPAEQAKIKALHQRGKAGHKRNKRGKSA